MLQILPRRYTVRQGSPGLQPRSDQAVICHCRPVRAEAPEQTPQSPVFSTPPRLDLSMVTRGAFLRIPPTIPLRPARVRLSPAKRRGQERLPTSTDLAIAGLAERVRPVGHGRLYSRRIITVRPQKRENLVVAVGEHDIAPRVQLEQQVVRAARSLKFEVHHAVKPDLRHPHQALLLQVLP